ncbi:MAG: ATP-binding protein [Rhodospirillales bacterium]
MSRLLPDTLAGRTILILIVGLGLFHLWSIWIYRIGTENLLGASRDRGLAERLVATMNVLETLPLLEREKTAHALSADDLEIHWSPVSLVADPAAVGGDAALLRDRLRQLAPELADDRLRFGYADDAAQHRHVILAAMQMDDGSWVTFGLNAFELGRNGGHDVLGSLSAMALGILVLSILLVRSINAPLRDLARAADRIGRDITAEGAAATGPREIRQVAGAFNTMQARIGRLIADRTQMLAAVSHDLKTPITRLRLRAAFIGDAEARRMVEADLDEMEKMLEAALVFLRGEATQEESRTVDLVSILRTICDQAADAGHDVALSGAERAPLLCRPLALKRAFSNLVDNAIKYGTRARVSIADEPDEMIVTIDDDGPGIPEGEHETVFEPFYRREGSRNRETGGTGLGLTIARTAVRARGGDISLANRPGGGLRLVVLLPKPMRQP